MLSQLSNKSDLSLRVLSIDPGTINLGYALSYTDFKNKLLIVDDCNTISIDTLVTKVHEYEFMNYGKNITMYETIYRLATDLLNNFHPDFVVSESPYLNSKFPIPYAMLTICTQAVQKACFDYRFSLPFMFIDPASVKTGVGVKGNNGDKNLMRNAVLQHPNIKANIDLSLLDEHSIDSIAVGYRAFTYLGQ